MDLIDVYYKSLDNLLEFYDVDAFQQCNGILYLMREQLEPKQFSHYFVNYLDVFNYGYLVRNTDLFDKRGGGV